MGMSYEGNHRFVSNAEQPQCPRCGQYISRSQITDKGTIQRIDCGNHNTGTGKITVYGDERVSM